MRVISNSGQKFEKKWVENAGQKMGQKYGSKVRVNNGSNIRLKNSGEKSQKN